MTLLEREPELQQLRAAFEGLTSGVGRAVAVRGEAGGGKSALVQVACADLDGVRLLRGACDPLSTPRPLGPVRDIAADLGGPVPGLTEPTGPVSELCEDVLRAVADVPSVVVIEDGQWIDEASVDVLRFLVRRIDHVPVVVVITYRDAEIHPTHPLRPLLGDLARAACVTTIDVPPLSVAAVAELLGGSGLDARAVHDLTGGNAFYAAEIARHHHAAPLDDLPPSLRDAVLAGTTGLDDADLEVLQLIACAPDGLDDRLLPTLDIDVPTLRRLDVTGLLIRSRRGISFHHELARLAVEESIPVGVAGRLHDSLLSALERLASPDLAVLTHHAVAARRPERALPYAIAATDEAVRTGSHREAVSFLRVAVDNLADDAPVEERALLLERLSFELYVTNQLPEAIDVVAQATQLWRAADDSAGLAGALDRRALFEYYSGHFQQAVRHADLAARVARSEGPELSVGLTSATRGYLAFRECDLTTADECDDRALRVAERLDHDPLRIRSLIVERAVALTRGSADARDELLRLVEEAVELGLDEIGSMGWSNLSSIDVEHRRLDAAEEILERSLPFALERDIAICSNWQTAVRARLDFLRGDWASALEAARWVLDGGGPPLARLWPHLVVGLVELRADGDGGELDQAWELALQLNEPLSRLPVLSALAEQAWLSGRADDRLAEAAGELDEPARVPGLRWAVGDLAVWLTRLGLDVDHSLPVAEPFALELEGRGRDAAAWWDRAGCPFETALAAVHTGDDEHRRSGVESLDLLGAVATADRCRAELRRRGAQHVPARPRASTRSNPAGLTNRQLDVARLMAKGLTNAEIAAELFISTKTADHHVSAVLSKLGVSSRRELAPLARELGLD